MMEIFCISAVQFGGHKMPVAIKQRATEKLNF